CSPISSARMFPASADAKSSAAPDVPESSSTSAGCLIVPSPGEAVIGSRTLPLRSLIASVPPGATNRRASASPWSASPVDVRRTAKCSHAFPDRHLAGRLVVDRADVIAATKSGFRGRRAVAGGDDPQIVLTREVQADISRRQRLLAFDFFHLVGREVRAVGIQ